MSLIPRAESGFQRVLANRLGELRAARKTSQVTLANELGIDQGRVSRVEAGKSVLTVEDAFAWLEALGFTPNESASILSDLWAEESGRPPGLWGESGD